MYVWSIYDSASKVNVLTKVVRFGELYKNSSEKSFNITTCTYNLIMMYIQGFGISPAYANRIYKRYGLESIKVINENPYRLADEVKGIGFLKADEIALKNGMPKDSPFRVESAVMYVLKQMSEDGDVFGHREKVEKDCRDFLQLDVSYVENAVKSLIQKKKIICEDDALYLIPLYKAETYAAKKIVELLQSKTKRVNITKKEVKAMGKELDRDYAPEQVQAIIESCRSNVLILTGGPGTGKTTTVNGIIHMLKKHGMDAILCAAPTGKASKRMKETTGEKAQTIHRTLEVKSEGAYGFKFGKNEKTPLEGDAIIIDESSMIDMELMASVLKAIPEGMKLILVGDIDQLPSVGCGNVLHEMIDSNVVPIVRLKTIFRQAAESQIIKNAHLINEGVVPSFKNNRNGDYFFMDVDGMEQERIRDYIVTYVCDNLPRYYNVGADEIQVLAPMKKGPTGVWELNDYIQNRINPPSATKQIIPCNDHLLRVGDKVMYTCNDYDKKIFNGDVGKIVSICLTQNEADDADEDNADESAKRGFVVDFDGNRVHFDLSKAQDFILAYATTIHKSQGSEYDIVVMPLTTANYIMLQRNLLYTAVTRAKKVFVLFGQKNAVARAVKNLTVVNRNTRLGSRISEDAGFLLEKQNTKKHERKTA